MTHVDPNRNTVLQVTGLRVSYRVNGVTRPALHGVDLLVHAGEIVGVVGESGCGKSTLASAIPDLLPPGGRLAAGSVRICGDDVRDLDSEGLRRLRGPGAAMVFQDPFTSLNPAFSVGYQLVLAQAAHASGRSSRRGLRERAEEMLGEVGIPEPARALRAYPHQLSGGQQQRVMIAMALLLRPRLLIADEPTSALDVTTEAQILRLLRWLRDEHGTAILFVSHDLGSVAQLCDTVTIMYAGRVVETAPTARLFRDPAHPYTRALLDSVPSWRRPADELATIPGRPPGLTDSVSGCAFEPRCPHARAACIEHPPELVAVERGFARCHIHDPRSAYHRLSQPETEVARG